MNAFVVATTTSCSAGTHRSRRAVYCGDSHGQSTKKAKRESFCLRTDLRSRTKVLQREKSSDAAALKVQQEFNRSTATTDNLVTVVAAALHRSSTSAFLCVDVNPSSLTPSLTQSSPPHSFSFISFHTAPRPLNDFRERSKSK